MRHLLGSAVLACAVVLVGQGGMVERGGYTLDFGLENTPLLVPDGGNRFATLEPGHLWRYETPADSDRDENVEVEVVVHDRVRALPLVIDGLPLPAVARVVEEREWVDGELVQRSLQYLARCIETNNVYVLGEDVDVYEDGRVVNHDGSWRAGEKDARVGLVMPGFILLGARYWVEYAPEVSMTTAEHVRMGVAVDTPAGRFNGCVVVEERSPLEPDEIVLKTYAPRVGLLRDEDLELVQYIAAPSVQ